EVARELSGAARRPHLVVVTAYEQYAVEAVDPNAADYQLKPVTEERLARTVAKLKDALGARQPAPDLERLLRRLAQQEPARNPLRWIRASKKSGEGEITEQIAVADVVYLQADDKYTCVYARQGSELREWLIRVSLSELARDLDPADFAQIHRSVIVNLHAVAGTRRDIAGKLFVRLREHARELPVARQYVHLFRQM
ncbi:MAG: LytR/AlgR family response regulator transcription factor, partial [Betaproteobacteria bacterium]